MIPVLIFACVLVAAIYMAETKFRAYDIESAELVRLMREKKK